MKKLFPLQESGKDPKRVLELVRSEVGRYINREKRKPLEMGWARDFACRVGPDETAATSIDVKSVPEAINRLADSGALAVFVEINASKRAMTPRAGSEE